MKKKKVLLIDMDNTIADFTGGVNEDEKVEFSPESMFEEGFFYNLKPVVGALGAIKKLIDSDLFDVWICSIPVSGLHNSYSDKSAWIAKYFPKLIGKIILCQNKKMIKADLAIDDKKDNFDGSVRVYNPVVRKANQRYEWHRLAEQLIAEERDYQEKQGTADHVPKFDDIGSLI